MVATVAALANRLATTSTSALRPPAARGAFEVAVEDLFLSSSGTVKTLGQGGRALQLLRGDATEKVRVRSPCVPYGASRRPPSVGQVDGPALLQHLIEYLASLTSFHGRAVPNGVFAVGRHGFQPTPAAEAVRRWCRLCPFVARAGNPVVLGHCRIANRLLGLGSIGIIFQRVPPDDAIVDQALYVVVVPRAGDGGMGPLSREPGDVLCVALSSVCITQVRRV